MLRLESYSDRLAVFPVLWLYWTPAGCLVVHVRTIHHWAHNCQDNFSSGAIFPLTKVPNGATIYNMIDKKQKPQKGSPPAAPTANGDKFHAREHRTRTRIMLSLQEKCKEKP